MRAEIYNKKITSMAILRFNEFISGSAPQVNESGIPLYRGTVVNPERTIKRNKLLEELQNLLTQFAEGKISEITVLAEIPTQGKNAPQYLKDIYAEMGVSDDEEEEEEYDPETDVYKGNRDINPDDSKQNIFVDSEFIVKNIDFTKNVILATPYSLKRKNIIVEIDPDNVDEVVIS